MPGKISSYRRSHFGWGNQNERVRAVDCEVNGSYSYALIFSGIKGKCTLQANKTYVMFEITDKQGQKLAKGENGNE